MLSGEIFKVDFTAALFQFAYLYSGGRSFLLTSIFEKNSLPYAPITAPHELLDDPHLHATGGLAPMSLNDGRSIHTVLLPLSMNQERLKVRQPAPHLGEHNASLLKSLGYTAEEIQKLSPPT